MIDYHKNLVTALKTIGIPVHYEMALHSGLKTPCISYMEVNNYVDTTGDTIGYSKLNFQVKVWDNNIGNIQKYALQIDNVLRPLGFKRISSGELYDNNSAMMQKILTYEAMALENYEGGK